MLNLLWLLFTGFGAAFRSRRDLALENLALRQQLAVLQRTCKRPRLQNKDRLFWVWLSRIWTGWRQSLLIVKPATVVSWHRRGFRFYWSWLSQRKALGRPAVSPQVRDLIREMAQANPLWGAPRIHGELLKLGIGISERTVSRLMPRRGKHPSQPSQTWRTFLHNHLGEIAAIDFFTVPTATFRVLFVFIVVAPARRRVLHFNVTAHPTAEWTAQQVVEAFPGVAEAASARYLLRDRDRIYGGYFRRRVRGMGLEEILTAPASPWQNAYAERLIGTIRRECLDHVIVLGESYLRHVLRSYFGYYHRSRKHLSLAKDAPEPRAVQGAELGEVLEIAEVGGLHHRYERRAA